MFRIFAVILSLLVILVGCSSNEPETNNASNDLLEVSNINRLQTAYQTELEDSLQFYIASEAVNDQLTFKTGSKLIIQSDNDVNLSYTAANGDLIEKSGTLIEVDIENMDNTSLEVSTVQPTNIIISIQ